MRKSLLFLASVKNRMAPQHASLYFTPSLTIVPRPSIWAVHALSLLQPFRLGKEIANEVTLMRESTRLVIAFILLTFEWDYRWSREGFVPSRKVLQKNQRRIKVSKTINMVKWICIPHHRDGFFIARWFWKNDVLDTRAF